MADLIKKIKIKKQDGTFTDYIPIGAEASNVSMNNGKSVQYNIGDIDVENDGSVAAQLDNINSDLQDVCYFIFPKFISNSIGGDCNLIQYEGKNILIDSHHSDYWNDIQKFLEDNGADHIDYFICSHFHSDHIGNFEHLIDAGFIDVNTHLYMPADVSWMDWPSVTTTYKTICANKGLTYYTPNEGEVISIGRSLKITFTNCNATIMNTYYAATGDQNSVNMICLIEHKNIKALYTGDANSEVVKRLQELDFIKTQIDLLKIPHHGIDQRSCLWYKQMSPVYAVQPGGRIYSSRNETSWSGDAGFLNALGTKIYAQQWQTDYIKFISNGNSILNIQGKIYNESMGHYADDIYVDINSTLDYIPDGTVTKPFHEIQEAIAWISNMPYGQYTIHLTPGHYAFSSHWEYTVSKNSVCIEIPHQIIITGNTKDRDTTIINGIHILNSNVRLMNISVDGSYHNEAIYIRNGSLECENVRIFSSDTLKGGIYNRGGIVYCIDCYFNNLNSCFEGNCNGTFISNHSTIGTITNNVVWKNYRTRCGFIQETNTIFENEASKYALGNIIQYDKYIKPVLLYSNQTPEYENTEIDLSYFTITNFRMLKIDYLDKWLRFGTTGWIHLDSDTRWIPITMTLRSGNDAIDERGLIFQFKNKKLNYINPYTKHITTSTDTATYTTNREIFVSQIWGIPTQEYDYVDLHN